MERSCSLIKKWRAYLLIILAFGVFAAIADVHKTSERESTGKNTSNAKAVFKVDEQPVPYKNVQLTRINIGIEDVVDPEQFNKAIKDVTYTLVPPMSQLKLHFESVPLETNAGYWDTGFGHGGFLNFGPVHDAITLTNQPGRQIIMVQAVWEHEEAHYIIPIEIEQIVPYQRLLSEYEGSYSLLSIYDNGTNPVIDYTDEKYKQIHKAQTAQYSTIEEAQKQYPGLNIQSVPYFALFNHEKIVLETDALDDIIHFLKDDTDK